MGITAKCSESMESYSLVATKNVIESSVLKFKTEVEHFLLRKI